MVDRLKPDFPIASSMNDVGPSALLRLLARAASPEIVSFAVGMPTAELIPARPFSEACVRVLAESGNILQYGVPDLRLKGHIVKMMSLRGVTCTEDEIFLTTGSQQAMDLLGRLLLDPGGRVLLEDKVFEGMRTALRSQVPEIVNVPAAADVGVDVDALEEILDSDPPSAFIYLIPEGHNPLGVSYGLAQRRRLLELSERYRLPILEDDAYGFLSYKEEPLPALRSGNSERVFYLGSFSKIFAPSLRIGWIVAPKTLMPRLSALKHAADLDSATFAQRALADCLDHLDFPAHLEAIRQRYRRRRDVLTMELENHFPGGVTPRGKVRWHRPQSGFYLWMELWPGADSMEELEKALEYEKVAFTPGEVFTSGDGSARHCLRMSFAGLSRDGIAEGVGRFARSLARA